MDTLTPRERSARMSLVRNKYTKPEKVVRRVLWRLGYRYRLHRRTLPGHPDIVFGTMRKAIFVHGCFWHRHPKCSNCRLPKSRLNFWKPKLRANRFRDLRKQRALREAGWDFMVVWECELRNEQLLVSRLRSFLNS